MSATLPISIRLVVLLLTLNVYGVIAGLYALRADTAGDEPSYLLIAHSIVTDGDVDFGNNLANRDYQSFYRGTIAPNQIAPNSRAGHSSPVHPVGFPALLSPAYALGLALDAPKLVSKLAISAIASLVALNIFLLAYEATRKQLVAWLVWGAMALSLPVAAMAAHVYPETVAALAIVVFFRKVQFRWDDWRARDALVAGMALVSLPLLHPKYVAIVFVLLGVVLHRAWRTRPRQWGRAVSLTVFAAGGIACLAVVNLWLFGATSLAGGLGEFTAQLYWFPQPFEVMSALRGLGSEVAVSSWGEFFDFKEGLFLYSPLFLVAFARCAYLVFARRDAIALATLLVVLPAFALIMVTSIWWKGGFGGYPNRYVVHVLPLLAYPLASAIDSALTRRRLLEAICLASLAFVGLWGYVSFVLDPDSLVIRSTSSMYDIQYLFPNSRTIIAAGIRSSLVRDQALLALGWAGLAVGGGVALCLRWRALDDGVRARHRAIAVTAALLAAGAATLISALPSSRERFLAASTRDIPARNVPSQTGSVEDDPLADDGPVLRSASPGWLLIYGSDQFPSGLYRVGVRVRCPTMVAAEPAFSFQVVFKNGTKILTERPITREECSETYTDVVLQFASHGEGGVEIRMFAHTSAEVWVDRLVVRRDSEPSR